MFKASYRFLFALLLACCAAGSGLFWPRFVDAAVPLTGWARADLMPPQSGLIALPVVLFSMAALGMFMFGIFALIDAGFDETKRLHAQDARADRLGHELEDLQRDFETQQGALRAALLERTHLREENARQGHEIAKLKAERAAGSACGEPGRTVPYRIKAEPLKISDLREGDEVIYLGDRSPAGLSTIKIGKVENCSTFGIDRVLIDGKNVWHSEILGVLRRIGS